MKKRAPSNAVAQKLYRYLQVTRGKVILWGVFLLPYVVVLVVFQKTTPIWIQHWVYSSSAYLQRVVPSPFPEGRQVLTPTDVDFSQLTMAYFFSTYLWSCIVVSSFGIIVSSGKARRSKRK
jgi:hypothetical protein